MRLLPLATEIGDWGLDVEGYVETPGQQRERRLAGRSDGALEALGERLRAGRAITAADAAGARPWSSSTRKWRRVYWPGQDPIGRRIRMGSATPTVPG